MLDKSRAAPVVLLTLIAGLLAVGFVMLFDQFEHIGLFIMVAVMFLLGAIPIALKISRGTFDLFEPTVPYFASYFLAFGAGALFTLLIRGVAYDNGILAYLDTSVAYCTLGLACVMLGYAMTGRVVKARESAPVADPGWPVIGVLYTVGAAGELLFASIEERPMMMNMFVSGAVSLISQLSFLATFTFFYVLYLTMAGRAGLPYKLLLWGWMIPTKLSTLFLRIGNKSALIFAVGLAFIAFWYARKRVPWKTVFAFVLVVTFLVFPFYYTFRNVQGANYTKEYRLERSFEKLGGLRFSEYTSDALLSMARRLAIVNSTVAVVRDAGVRVDFQYGNTLALGVVSALIPRFLWPDKPTTNIGREFGKTFRITGFSNYSSISPTMVGELYWNFHVAGVVLGMFLLGVVMRVIYLRFRSGGENNPIRLAMYVTLVYATALACEGGVGALEGRLFKELLLLLVTEKAFLLMQDIRGRRSGARVGGAVVATAR